MVLRNDKVAIGYSRESSPTHTDLKALELIEAERSVTDAQLRTEDLPHA